MAFTEFCCRSGGSNMNGGGLASGAEPATTAVFSNTNGNWNGSNTFIATVTVTGASVGDFAHVFVDGSTTPTYIARITNISSATITLSTTAFSGTPPSSSATGRSIRVGGAWAGPSGAVGFPFPFVTGDMVNSAQDRQRVNLKNDQTYNITAGMDMNGGSGGYTPVTFQGYTSTFGDKGRATIDGGTSGASYILLTVNNNGGMADFYDLIFNHNGATGTAALVDMYRTFSMVRCGFRNSKGIGQLTSYANTGLVIECEAVGNGDIGFQSGSSVMYVRCIASGNTGHGFKSVNNTYGTYWKSCIAVGNGAFGWYFDGVCAVCDSCDAFNNVSDGFFMGWAGPPYMLNCNAVKNGGYGFNGYFNPPKQTHGLWHNCGTGGGAYANTSGATSQSNASEVSGMISYTTHPWVDPDNGDFRISASAAKGTGKGSFTWTDAAYSGRANNISYPDVGAEQHLETGGASGPLAQLKLFGRGAPY